MFSTAAQLARELDARIPKILSALEETVKTADLTLQGANKAIEGVAGDNSPLHVELIKTLKELGAAAKSLRVLADYMESHPESILRGKGK
jgi:paraquat-inducible protein B